MPSEPFKVLFKKSKLMTILVYRVIEETSNINILIVSGFPPDLLGNSSIYIQTWEGEHIVWDISRGEQVRCPINCALWFG